MGKEREKENRRSVCALASKGDLAVHPPRLPVDASARSATSPSALNADIAVASRDCEAVLIAVLPMPGRDGDEL